MKANPDNKALELAAAWTVETHDPFVCKAKLALHPRHAVAEQFPQLATHGWHPGIGVA